MKGLRTMTRQTDEGWTIYAADPVRGRSCGTCHECCTRVPVELDDGYKAANVRCRHLKSRGCGIYEQRPRPCQYWSCRWLFDPTTSDLRRPDRSGYIIDPEPCTILANEQPVDCIQLWCDPKRPGAHRDPALRAWLVSLHERFGMIAIVRYNSRDGIIVVPPAATEKGEWLEIDDMVKRTEQEREQKLQNVGAADWAQRHLGVSHASVIRARAGSGQ
jgi:hypothetical protein